MRLRDVNMTRVDSERFFVGISVSGGPYVSAPRVMMLR